MNPSHRIVAERRTYSDLAHTHDHEFAQLILPLQGSLFVQTDSHQFELSDRLFWLPPRCQHTFYATNTNEFLVLDIPASLLIGQTTTARGGLSQPLDDRWQALRLLLLSEVEDCSTAAPNLSDLFHYAYRLLLQADRLQADRLQADLPRSLRYIHANYDQPLTTQQLAQLEGYSLTYYCEWFKTLTGTTPKLYIQTLRLEKAKALLANTDQTILQIAQQVGYEHHASLTRLFQQTEQTTPAAYRQQTRRMAKSQPKSG